MTEYYGTCPKSRWSCSNRSIEAMLGYTTDRWTDTVPFHRPCSAYYTSSTNILWRDIHFVPAWPYYASGETHQLIRYCCYCWPLLASGWGRQLIEISVTRIKWITSEWTTTVFVLSLATKELSYSADDSLQANIISSLSKVPRSILTNYGNTLAGDMHGTCDEKSFLLICGARERNVQAFVRRKCQFKPRDEYDTRRLYL